MKNKIVENPPYTVVANTSINPSFQVLLKVGGLRELIEGLKEDDMLRITFHAGYKATEFEIVKNGKD